MPKKAWILALAISAAVLAVAAVLMIRGQQVAPPPVELAVPLPKQPTPTPAATAAPALAPTAPTPIPEDAIPAGPVWPAMARVDELAHKLDVLRKKDDATSVRAAAPDFKARIEAALAENPPPLPGSDAGWLRRRIEDLRKRAPLLDNPDSLDDASLLKNVKDVIALTEVLSGAADPSHIMLIDEPQIELIPAGYFSQSGS